MITFEEAKKKVIPQGSKITIKKSCEYNDWYVFVLNDRPGSLIDPLSVHKTTGRVEAFNPITVGGKAFKEAMDKLK